MRRGIVRAITLVGLVTFASIAFAYSTGPPASRTGAPAIAGRPAEMLCTICHMGNTPNNPLGLLEILDTPRTYEPGAVYAMRVRLGFTGHPAGTEPKWGFEITSVQATTGRGIGTWIPSNGLQIVNASSPSFPGRQYLEHGGDWQGDTASVHYGDPGPVEWHFSWQAPPGDSGAVLFFAAGNAANGDGCSFCGGDFIFTTRDTMLPPDTVTVDVPPIAIARFNWLGLPNPNPFNQCVDLSFEIAKAGPIHFSIYDVQGRSIRTLLRGWHDAGPGAAFWNGKRDDGTQASNGVYFVRLIAPGVPKPLVQRLTLAR